MSSEAVIECSIDTGHEDQILDVSFNHYGTRMATSGSDGVIKVWSQNGKNQWKCSASWKCQDPVFRVTWAHPEFGEVIATTSLRRTAVIWQEVLDRTASSPDKVVHKWVQKAELTDSTTTVTDVKFAPHHLGLQLATCSAKGMVYIYEAPDVMNLKAQWTMQHQINCDMPCSCLSWSTNKLYNPMLAVGSDDLECPSGGKVTIYEYNENTHAWVMIHVIMQLTDPVSDLQFAPNGGLDYHTLAIASTDMYLYHLKNIEESEKEEIMSTNTTLNINQVAQFDDHNCDVTRVAWNDFGNVLISNGQDGQILLWMENYMQIWKSIGSLKSDPSQDGGFYLERFSGLDNQNYAY